MKVFQALADALARHGVDTVFGLMGNANLLYLPAFADTGGRFVAVTHEAGAVAMADGYARMSGKVGMASVTHGPAFTNTLTSLVEAVRNRSHVLLITGDPPPVPSHFHHFDIETATAAAGAGYEKVYEPASLVRDLNRALRRIVAERRPVVLNIPIAFMQAEAGEQAPVALPLAPPAAAGPLPEALDRALGLVTSAQRPLILAGHGAATSGARDSLMGLADRLGAALATTVLAKELFAGHPRDIGIFGSLAHSVAGAAIAESDCVIAFGAGLNMWTALNGDLFRGKKVVHVDIDPARFGSYTPVDECVAGDARLTAEAMNSLLDEVLPAAGKRHWAERIEKAMAAYSPQEDFADLSGPDTVDIRSAMIRLDRVLPERRTVVSDIGRFDVGVWPYLRVADPLHFTVMGAFGSIGLGLAGAIGAAMAGEDRPVVATVGDGGFMMHLAELTTAVRQKLPIVVLVLNDGAYGAEHYKLKNHGYDPAHSAFAWPDLADLATVMGARALTVRKAEEIDAVGELVPTLDGPLLVDVRLDPDVNLVRY
ncbi:thiamine pyrophosphate-binding protein [Streptomyces netropsis]|uniref:Thiamine pyrophosphate-dependent acetolactate synthase large subunit-like protein n=1 Tax=Streptomyces netropsis TaxID=55404 RepID=A0A7W7PET7_STRNE|nr:thiamine pyrophosphate-binding protein [Streptomyces netropsis]MBB4887344.1 thiamine pyrophosphate-dependent acetolactate synthase large subunit-like protein [Streptomyces netropsis]GGR09620.1 acetolactate synthase [Streptomyces netropsis]